LNQHCYLLEESSITADAFRQSSFLKEKSRAVIKWTQVHLAGNVEALARPLLGQGVASFNEAPDEITSLSRLQIVSLLDAFGLLGQIRIHYCTPKPARVVPMPEMKQPRIVIDALGDLAENCQILSAEFVSVCRAPEVEAPIPHIALAVFPQMAEALHPAGQYSYRERRFSVTREPPDRVTAVVRKAIGQCQSPSVTSTKRL
jgi:hypothetical protein